MAAPFQYPAPFHSACVEGKRETVNNARLVEAANPPLLFPNRPAVHPTSLPTELAALKRFHSNLKQKRKPLVEVAASMKMLLLSRTEKPIIRVAVRRCKKLQVKRVLNQIPSEPSCTHIFYTLVTHRHQCCLPATTSCYNLDNKYH